MLCHGCLLNTFWNLVLKNNTYITDQPTKRGQHTTSFVWNHRWDTPAAFLQELEAEYILKMRGIHTSCYWGPKEHLAFNILTLFPAHTQHKILSSYHTTFCPMYSENGTKHRQIRPLIFKEQFKLWLPQNLIVVFGVCILLITDIFLINKLIVVQDLSKAME